MKIKFTSIQFKIGLFYALVLLAISFTVFKAVLYTNSYHSLYLNFDSKLKINAQEINNAIASYMDILGPDRKSFIFAARRVIRLEGEHPNQDKIKNLEQQWAAKVETLGLKADYVCLFSSKGKLILTSQNLSRELRSSLIKDVREMRDKGRFRNLTFDKDNLHLRVIEEPFAYQNLEPYIIQVAMPIPPDINILRSRLLNIAIAIFIILLFAGFTGRAFLVRTLRPVVEIAKTAGDITLERLHVRAKIGKTDAEIKVLADAFNDMVKRLEASFRYVDEFSSHVAHELKTPLAIIKGESEVALRKERNIEEYKRVLMNNLTEVERMLSIINDLLLLARLDNPRDAIKFEQFNLTESLGEVYEYSKISASKKDISVSMDMRQKEIAINGNRLHLRRLFTNLIDNAIKFTPMNGKIKIAVKCEYKKVKITISDTGRGIPKEDIPKLFERFFRAEVKGDEESSGHGLGLSISRSIARLHKGEITVESELSVGSSFTVIFPTATPCK